ncbi:GreA/GreB family elongation factor [Sphingobium sufflavum]|uniref:GreA/GreB family elongation factor n=1 Tax=Sphingobium sufflavum TaxID=1129547 RepID=UPI001F1D6BF7|nr:GreA/GreB family elongation factor [Sphingobium sufflavum]MCE7796651.1 GreA/GreB family elongation factor [Sphingobium sufflavum]
MSVAFRRESDEEHLEPKFEIPIPPGPNLVTARGLRQIEAKVAEWEATVAAITEEEPRKTAQRDLRYWRTRLATAQPAPVPTGASVAFGCTVTFRLNGAVRTITLVGDDEAEPTAGLIAFTAPLARALIDGEPGDLLSFAGKEDAIELLEISVT